MATTVVMEALSPTMEEGRLVEWKKQPGESVAVGDVLAEVETDKAVMELVARAGGSLLRHVVAPGTTVPVGEPLAYIGEPGEQVDGASAPARAAAAQGTQPVPTENQPTSMPPATPAAAVTEGHGEVVMPGPSDEQAAAPVPASGRSIKASPLARKLAAERGLDLRGMTGTGPEGRIVLRDIESAGASAPRLGAPGAAAKAAPAAPARPAAPGPARPATPAAPAAGFTDVPLSQMRKTIAKRLVQSLGP
ncbi:MAG TPA: biotin/lipoyl-containing protein, partial [Gemmatimonadales bacterium]|nr:biotin/lipoyl-containing protein [Gemmatimonadales bacterium]